MNSQWDIPKSCTALNLYRYPSCGYCKKIRILIALLFYMAVIFRNLSGSLHSATGMNVSYLWARMHLGML